MNRFIAGFKLSSSYTIYYLFIFNLFIVDKFISITTRIAFHKQPARLVLNPRHSQQNCGMLVSLIPDI